MTPSESDIKKLQQRIEKVRSSLVDGRLPEKVQLQMLRNAIRQVWMRHPVKLLKLDLAKVADTDPTTRRKWAVECEHCKRLVNLNFAEVDHIVGQHSLKELGQLIDFYEGILNVTLDDLQVLCKTCHGIKTYSEKEGATLIAAAAVKAAIKWCKMYDKETLQKRLLNAGTITTSKDAPSMAKCRALAEHHFRGVLALTNTIPPELLVYDILEE